MVRRSTRKSSAAAAFPRRGHDHGRCVSDALSTAAALCARDGERLTPLRKRVLEFVWSSHQPIGAYAILDRLRTEHGRALGPPTVYRALDFLVERGLVHRLASLNAFVGCPQPGDAHIVQFLICRQCGMAAELDDARIAGALDRSAAMLGFRVEDQVIELSGICGQCLKESPGAGARADGE
ncbi:MAG TPA: Fur family transcriptional regulator [Alphaproteobacteria bacterium]|jgi:Fur family zinc uptake transcriptional regulator|nr:Fur family transcriptional regulator [Alphaproteobacteria bacterium]